MNTRFQVFVSSTQKDLKDERERITNELNRIGHIAVGMEQFPATDEEQFEYIQRIIDDSDYYVVVVKGRYGSEDAGGKSYTEKEFEYAVSTKKPALAFLYATPGKLRLEETDNDPEKMRKLQAFRARLEAKRIVRYWSDTSELISSIKDSINDIVRRQPGVGWVRGNQVADPSLYKELELLRKQNTELQKQILIHESEEISFPPHLSHGKDELEFEIIINKSQQASINSHDQTYELHRTNTKLSWDSIFNLVVPIIYDTPDEDNIKRHISRFFTDRLNLPDDQYARVSTSFISTIGHQFEALGLIRILSSRNTYVSTRNWEITDKGRRLVAHLKAIRRTKDAPSGETTL